MKWKKRKLNANIDIAHDQQIKQPINLKSAHSIKCLYILFYLF